MINIDHVRAIYSYDPISGVLINTRSNKPIIAETMSIYGAKIERAHVIWALYYNEWPNALIDHADRDRTNNRISNLRKATHSQNGFNTVKEAPYGYKGVTFDANRSKKWRAQIRINGRKVNLGRFYNLEEAAEAYMLAALEHHGEFACLEGKPNALTT